MITTLKLSGKPGQAPYDTGGDQVFVDCPRGVAELVAHTLQ